MEGMNRWQKAPRQSRTQLLALIFSAPKRQSSALLLEHRKRAMMYPFWRAGQGFEASAWHICTSVIDQREMSFQTRTPKALRFKSNKP